MSALIDSSSISAAQFSNCYTFTSSVLDCIFIFLKTAITKNDTLEKKRKKKKKNTCTQNYERNNWSDM